MSELQSKITQLWSRNADMQEKVRIAAINNPVGMRDIILSDLSDAQIIRAVEGALQGDISKDKEH